VLLDQSECGREPSPAQAIVLSNGQLGFEPELGLAFNVLNVHVSPEFLAGEEEKPIPPNPENRGTHNPRIPEIHMRRIGVGCGPGWGRALRRRLWSVTPRISGVFTLGAIGAITDAQLGRRVSILTFGTCRVPGS